MAELDDLIAQIPTDQIAGKLGKEPGEVNTAIQTLVPLLVGGLQQKADDDGDHAAGIESVASQHAPLLDGGVSVDQVDENEGENEVARLFGGNDSGQVASALSGAGLANSDLIKQLLPIVLPIVLAYVGKKLTQQNAPEPAPQAQAPSSGGLGDVLGSILGGQKSDNPLGNILGSVLGNQGGTSAITDILGGLLGGKK